MNKNIRSLFILFFLMGFALILTACGGGENGTITAKIAEAEGGVEAKQPTESAFSTAKVGLVIEEMGQVKTMDDGRAKLNLPNETIVRVTPMSLFTLESVTDSNSRFKLDVGTLWIILSGGKLEVDTVSGVATVRGSYMSVTVDETSGEVYITCLEGTCEVSNDTGSVTLKTGETARIKNANTAPVSGLMTEYDVQYWLAENPEAILVVDELGVPVVGDWAWVDSRANGIQDNDENGLPDVTVTLYKTDGTAVSRTRTNREGSFVFTHMEQGDYYLTFDPPENYKFVEKDVGNDDSIDSDVDENGATDVFTVGKDVNLDVDAGFVFIGDHPDVTLTPTHGHPPSTDEPPQPEIVELEIKYGDGEIVKARWHHTCPGKNVLIYFPWIGGDLNDWETYLSQLFPSDYQMSVLAVTYPGCEGGCKGYEPDRWSAGLEMVLKGLQDLPCIDENPNVILMGASIGADYALWMCVQFRDICKGVISLSPGGYIGQDLTTESMILMELQVPVLYMYALDDKEVASQSAWALIDKNLDATPWTFLVRVESGDHGIFMLNQETMPHVIRFLDYVFHGIP
jgi:hypothetical protein